MNAIRVPLRVVFYYEEDNWVAHCLEFDLVGCGKSKEEALQFLREAITTQVHVSAEDDNPENLFSPADGKYWAMWACGKHVAVGSLEIQVDSFQVESTDSREFSNDHPIA
jgi:predicted RNase H-like HicB family nuclease